MIRTLLVLAIAGCGLLAAVREQVVVLPTRPKVRQAFLLRVAGPGTPRAVAVLFPGGEGAVGLPTDGSPPQLNPRGNFLVRTRDLMCDASVAVAVMDAPSDHAYGMDDAFRSGAKHREDIGFVVADLRARFPGARIVLVGTSRGTISAAHACQGDAVVLTSTIFRASRTKPGLEGFDFGTIKAPLLFVHHAGDECPVCPYSAALKLGERFPLITVRGGAEPESGPCDPLAPHGFFGKEKEVVMAIRGWILGEAFARVV